MYTAEQLHYAVQLGDEIRARVRKDDRKGRD
jgi:hypothetical protein